VNRPLSMNRWMYVDGNPTNNIDPTGYHSCYVGINDPECQSRLNDLQNRALYIKSIVRSGNELPVEALAKFTDYAFRLFDNNIRGSVWAMTNVLNNIEINNLCGPSCQGLIQKGYGHNFIGEDFLAYNRDNYPHPTRGDWRKAYWDKTDNQAYHFWGFVAITFHDGLIAGHYGNHVHDTKDEWTPIDFREEVETPSWIKTEQDWNLTQKAIELGFKLRQDENLIRMVVGCDEDWPLQTVGDYKLTNPGNWIRINLKDPTIHLRGGR
jgi:hypothetical protein